ncbi:substrate-binding domain-containing protein [Pseudoruegeria sp. SK021]|uniref:substrate-binding domain-containing protein n=1 Tax=Pseudoruegeria sp. SK021 TaxID=1933035 RepID=UPI000A217507|nr:substrate-binding domain-containing protein [Pseudoruegeria sp. SK021]OSP55992.1 LacI family transcriptional regulator [Pseudoruegeria sp. SK021]
MAKAPRMIDVAQAAGVSPMTVSRAFRRDASVNETTRQRILAAADALGYVFDTTASNLRSQRTGFVAVTIPSLNNANFADTVRALSTGLAQHDLQILLGYTNYDMLEEEHLIGQFLRRRPEAIVVSGGKHTDQTRRMLANARVPVVEIWDLPDNPIGHVVGFSNAAAMAPLVAHLFNQGYRRIGFIGGDEDRDTRGLDRRRGYVNAMTAQGLDPRRLVASGPPPISMREGARAMSTLLARYPDIQAVICVSDLSAFGALTECQRRGISVPNDIAIAGFGDYEIADIAVPPLTTIDAHASEIGQQTAAMIVDLLQNKASPSEPRFLDITPTLLVRESTSGSGQVFEPG